jgi:hypothetical protein
MTEKDDVYFDASRKFREPRKFKKTESKKKGKEYKYIDPLGSFIQQTEKKIVKPKRATKPKKDFQDIDKKLVDILEQRRKIRKGREVGRTVDPEELLKIQELKKRAEVPSVIEERTKQAKIKEDEAERAKVAEQTAKEAREAGVEAREEGRDRGQEAIYNVLQRIEEGNVSFPNISIPSELLPMSAKEKDRNKQSGVYKKQLQTLNLERNPRLRRLFQTWLADNNMGDYPDEAFATVQRPDEDEGQYRERANFILNNYRNFKSESGRGLFGGKLVHPHLLGAITAHKYIHNNANKVINSLPAKHKGIKELENLKKSSKRELKKSINKHGEGGDFQNLLNDMFLAPIRGMAKGVGNLLNSL